MIPEKHREYLRRRCILRCRAGSLEPGDAAWVEKYGSWCQALCDGVISPITTEQQHFVQVFRGEALPDSCFEHIWMRYLSICEANGSKQVPNDELHQLFSKLFDSVEDGEVCALICTFTSAPVIAAKFLASRINSRDGVWHTENITLLYAIIRSAYKRLKSHDEKISLALLKNEVLAIEEPAKGTPPSNTCAHSHGADLDWSDQFDDLGSAYWEDYMGGSERQEI